MAKKIITTLVCWALAAFFGYLYLTFELPLETDLDRHEISRSDRFEEKKRIKNGNVADRTLHIYTSDNKHIIAPSHFGGYNGIASALNQGSRMVLYIWKKPEEDSYGIYKAEIGSRKILTFSESSKKRSNNATWGKYLAITFFALPIVATVNDKLKG